MSDETTFCGVKWFEVYDNITATVRFLVEERLYDADEILAVIEKPWKYEDEYQAMLAHSEGLLCAECEEKRGEKRPMFDGRVICEKCLADAMTDAEVERELAALDAQVSR